MKKILKMLPYPVSRKYLDEWLKENLDKKDLSENFFDGHGHYKDGDNYPLTVYVVKKTPMVFLYSSETDDYLWKIIGDDEWTKHKDTKPSPFKMKSRF